jgi:hypothetical protein
MVSSNKAFSSLPFPIFQETDRETDLVIVSYPTRHSSPLAPQVAHISMLFYLMVIRITKL